jgi:hypothetical protein
LTLSFSSGIQYFNIGMTTRGTPIDIDAFGFGVADQFRFVRLTDDPENGRPEHWGSTLDAVGAISSIAVPPIPEPHTWGLMMLGVLALGARQRLAAWRRPKDAGGNASTPSGDSW